MVRRRLGGGVLLCVRDSGDPGEHEQCIAPAQAASPWRPLPRINGVLGAFVVGARAVGPFLAGIAGTAFSGYESVFLATALLFCASAATLMLAHRAHRGETSKSLV